MTDTDVVSQNNLSALQKLELGENAPQYVCFLTDSMKVYVLKSFLRQTKSDV